MKTILEIIGFVIVYETIRWLFKSMWDKAQGEVKKGNDTFGGGMDR